MKIFLNTSILILFILNISCNSKTDVSLWSEEEKTTIHDAIRKNLDDGMAATRLKDIETYMSRLPKDLVIYDESGEVITREKQKEYAIRDWSIIDTTLHIEMIIDSILYFHKDSVIVYTDQKWERMMFQRDGVTKDTILTTQKHRETWKKNTDGWFGYEIEELGGEIFINGKKYIEE